MMATLDTVDLLQRLVAFPTVSHQSNLALIEWVAGYLREQRIESNLVYNTDRTKANLYASVGPLVPGGLALSGHTDVVPVTDQAWSGDPFRPWADDGRIYGRGTADMKGFIAAAIAQVVSFSAERLVRPVYLALSHDEEIGCLGAPQMIAEMRKQLPPPAMVVVGEPTRMRLANAHKGICVHRTRVIGKEAHSSLTHLGMSAVSVAGQLIAQLAELEVRARVGPQMQGAMPPYTSISTNIIHGGTAINILAGSCEFIWEVRAIPGDSADWVRTEVSRCADKLITAAGGRCSLTTETMVDVPPLHPGERADESRIADWLESGVEAGVVPFCSEAGQFQAAGWPAVVCGPGDIAQAHRPDEFVSLDQLRRCDVFLTRAVAGYCGYN